MGVIWKYPAPGPSREHTEILMPHGAEVTHFDGRAIWVEVPNPDALNETRSFRVVGTGWDFDRGVCVGTAPMEDGFVWHLLDVSRIPFGGDRVLVPASRRLWTLERHGEPMVDPDGQPIVGTRKQIDRSIL